MVADTASAVDNGMGWIQAAYDYGDHLHYSTLGQQAIGQAMFNSGHAAGLW